ncbi:MAG: alcohol dehydrogenase catalytic domain-containing protein [Chloroflexi bacterium]|nr:alcohol dehydrogenase catalytic domain-containing protein [Chloroflexota bacterium]MBP7041646.1 alcohol dehydrogenase catalytic domain-containing protein [Chloroflexota bacterium]
MSSKYELYREAKTAVPDKTWAWNMYGAGIENIGQDGRPEQFPVPSPGPNQMLVRIDSVGMCFSDVKLIKQGGSHPKLYNRDLRQEPTRLGHEVTLTVLEVGAELADTYHPGQRLAVQPDIYQNGKSTAYGYTVPGGLIQYHLIGPEVLDTDAGACLLPLEGNMGYAEASLLEPWGCVVASYTQRRRLEPKAGGTMWLIGRPGDERDYTFSAGLDAPATIVLTDVPSSVRALVAQTSAQVIVRDNLAADTYAALAKEVTGGAGFDDIVLLDPREATAVSTIARQIARRGTLNMVGETALDGLVDADMGRLHYDYIAFLGNQGPDIAASYGEGRNRCELTPRGAAVFIGAGGPMGQMHVQRAIELPNGPRLVIATEVNDNRLEAIKERFAPLAKKNNVELLVFNPANAKDSLYDFVMQATDGLGADDVVVSVPVAALMAEAATVLNGNGMLVFFAGVPNGTMAPLDLSPVYLSNAQFTGTSGLTLDDQRLVMERSLDGSLSPSRSVAAIGGMNAAQQGVEAMMDGRYPGKIVIFPQIPDLPLLGLDELADKLPDIAAHLGEGDVWTEEAEMALIETYWQA